MSKLSESNLRFLEALCEGNLSAPTGNPPVLRLSKAGLIRFLHRSDDLSVMAITPAGRLALQNKEAGE